MIHDKLINIDNKFGVSPKVYPTLIQTSGNGTILAVFTQNQIDVAISRGEKYPELKETLIQKIKTARIKK